MVDIGNLIKCLFNESETINNLKMIKNRLVLTLEAHIKKTF